MTPVCTYTDYFVICHGAEPAADEGDLRRGARDAEEASRGRCRPRSTGVGEANWIVADYLDVVLHVFTPEARAYYALEDLWGDVPSVSVEAVSA